MKLLGLFRHAKSSWEDVETRDFDRGLNARGRRGAAMMGRHIRDHGGTWDQVLASPAARVRETLDAAMEGAETRRPIVWNESLYLAEPATLIEALRKLQGDPASVVLCGHNPGLQELVFELAGTDLDNPLLDKVADKFPTAAFAVIELDIADWKSLGSGCGRLIHYVRPRDLDPDLGPEEPG